MKIKFDADGLQTIDVSAQTRLLDALLSRNVGVQMLCGGRGLCATCHVYVLKNPEHLTPPTSKESLTLSVLTGARANSRLSCQAHVIGDDVELAFPEGLYIDSVESLEKLIGQRTQIPILHPVTGEVLVAANKIIIRTVVEQLKSLDFEISKVKYADAKEQH
jgi:ferredoxin